MKQQNIFGRKRERKILSRIWERDEPAFLALYGRKHLGKTFLIREFFSTKKGLYLETTGVKDAPLSRQLENFTKALSATFFSGIPLQTPKSWDDAFSLLTHQMQQVAKKTKIVLFFDELPWLASKRSGLVQALDYFWNLHWSRLSNLTLVVCGSAASWMLEHLVHAKGGLYNRLTHRIHLQPFSLSETAAFLKTRGISLKHKQLIDLYMAIGGIPHYLKEVDKGKSTAQTLDSLCFHPQGLLFSEFQNLFNEADIHLHIVRTLAKEGSGLSRNQLIKKLSLSSGGSLNKRLGELIASGFVQQFVPFGRAKRDHYFRIVDEYTLFYLKWIEPLKDSGAHIKDTGYWQHLSQTPAVAAWAGYAFENLCLKHSEELRHALGLDKVACTVGSWRSIPPKGSKAQGAQVDLLFDRSDDAITLCEIKHSKQPFTLDKTYAKTLLQKAEAFESHFPKKQVFLALITLSGLKKNLWTEDLIDDTATSEDLL